MLDIIITGLMWTAVVCIAVVCIILSQLLEKWKIRRNTKHLVKMYKMDKEFRERINKIS